MQTKGLSTGAKGREMLRGLTHELDPHVYISLPDFQSNLQENHKFAKFIASMHDQRYTMEASWGHASTHASGMS